MSEMYLAQKEFGENSGWVIPLTFGRARIIYGPTDAQWVSDAW